MSEVERAFEPQDASQAEPLVPNAVRIAVVQSMNGNLTCCGPNDFSGGDYDDQMNAAIGWSIEAGHLPAAHYWVVVELSPIPTIPELRAQAERGEFPKSFVEEVDAYPSAPGEQS